MIFLQKIQINFNFKHFRLRVATVFLIHLGVRHLEHWNIVLKMHATLGASCLRLDISQGEYLGTG